MTIPNAAAALAILNVWTFMLFGLDKMRAEAGSWRVAESTLLTFSFFGGSLGAYAGRATFRHKTRKQPFSSSLHSIAGLQGFLLALSGGWILAG